MKIKSISLFLLALCLTFSGCGRQEAYDPSVDVNAVLDWQTSIQEASYDGEKFPVYDAKAFDDPFDEMHDTVVELMDGRKYTLTLDTADDTGATQIFSAEDGSYAVIGSARNEEGLCTSMGFQFSTYDSHYFTATCILPDDETIPKHLYTSDLFPQNVDLNFMSCEDAEKEVADFLERFAIDAPLQYTVYSLDRDSLQQVADRLYSEGRLVDPSTLPREDDDAPWPANKDHNSWYKQFDEEDECYYIVCRFEASGIGLYDGFVGLSDGTKTLTMEKMDAPNAPLEVSGPYCRLILSKDGIISAEFSTSCANLVAGHSNAVLNAEQARKALASLYQDIVQVKQDTVHTLELCYIPMYDQNGASFSLVPAWHAELYCYGQESGDQERFSVEHVFLDAYTGAELYSDTMVEVEP